jgi:hypothetical protein
MKDTNYFLLKRFIKMTFLTMQQTKHLVKKARSPSRQPMLSQIDHTQWPL